MERERERERKSLSEAGRRTLNQRWEHSEAERKEPPRQRWGRAKISLIMKEQDLGMGGTLTKGTFSYISDSGPESRPGKCRG